MQHLVSISMEFIADMVDKFPLTWWMLFPAITGTVVLLCASAALAVAADTLARKSRKSRGGGLGRSGIYVGRVWHVRFKPTKHRFSYPIFYCLLDLDELDVAFPWYMWPVASARLPALARFRSSDHLKGTAGEQARRATGGMGRQTPRGSNGGASVLADTVRDIVQEAVGSRPTGRVQLLTHLAYVGYCFNPVSFYYCMDASGERIETVVAEVSNTPWGEMHCYVLNAKTEGVEVISEDTQGLVRYRFDKEFHVSPFMSMEHTYDWRFTPPNVGDGSTLTAQTTLLEADSSKVFFDAKLVLKRRSFGAVGLCWHMMLFPMYTVWVQVLIHYQAAKLWWKKVPFFPHPEGAETAASRLVGLVMTPLLKAQEAWSARRQGGRSDSSDGSDNSCAAGKPKNA